MALRINSQPPVGKLIKTANASYYQSSE